MRCVVHKLRCITAFCLTMAMMAGQGQAYGQQDSTTLLDEIEVTAQRINLTDIGKHTDVIDSQAMALGQYNTLSAQLAMHTPLYVRTYGSGTLATLGIRGASAAHTQILWNGIPMRNPMLGLVDLALVPSFFTDEIAVHYGGHGAAFGSGAVGGLISLTNEVLTNNDQLGINLSAGSWGAWLAEMKLQYGFDKVRFSTKLFYQEADNNYRYKLNEGSPERNQVHHHLQNMGLLQEIMWAINDREQLTARLWYQYADREIPPTSTQNTSKSSQQDDNLRVSLQWMRKGEKFTWQCKTAWLEESIDYQDSLILLYTRNHFRTWLAEAATSFRLFPGMSITGGLYTEAVEATSANYDEGTSRHQYAAFTSAGLVHGNWVWRLQMREEVTDDQWSPLLLDLSTEWSGIHNITLKTSLSRNYRTPTLNDLHWKPGGNPLLMPEQGWTLEAGINYSVSGRNTLFSSSLTAYTRTIDQWIMWMPPVKDVSNYWSPINITQVNSKGLEARANMRINANDWQFNCNVGLDFSWSVFGAPLPEFNISEGDQLFYVPVENAIGGITAGFRQWSGYYNHHWFGPSPGINEDVEAANVGSGGLNYTFTGSKIKWTLYLQADNIWNVPYRIIERRPMPGRSFTGGVRFIFS